MHVLLDEQLDRRLKRLFSPEFAVFTVEECGWKGKKNGELLHLAQERFDAMVTMDKGIRHQQNLTQFNLRFVQVIAKTNRFQDIAPLIDKVQEAVRTTLPGQLAVVQ